MTLTTSLHKKLTFILSLAVSAFLFIVLTQTSHAATINVVAGTDAIEENSQCQLSEAIQNINDQAQTNSDCAAGDGTDDTINLPSGTVTLSSNLSEITKTVSITGQGMGQTIIDGSGIYHIFNNQSPETNILLSISGITITSFRGKAIYVEGGASVVVNNVEINGQGSDSNEELHALYVMNNTDSENSVTVTNVFMRNFHIDRDSIHMFIVGGNGGGTTNTDIQNITFDDIQNTGIINLLMIANGVYGGFNPHTTTGIIRNITINNIQSNSAIGTFFADNMIANGESTINLSVSNVTIQHVNGATSPYSDTAGIGVAALALDNSAVSIANMDVRNVILNDVTTNGTPSECAVLNLNSGFGGNGTVHLSLTSSGGNISDDNTCGDSFTHPTDQNNVDAADLHLGTLGDYGGAVPTIPLESGSIAIDAGVTVPGLTTDARGISRPQCSAYDSGAYEYNGTCPSTEDNDAIPAITEDAAPNAGDGNNDGIPDSEQSNVTSLPTPDGTYVTLEAPEGVVVNTTTITAATALTTQDIAYAYPLGLVSFTATTTNGATVPIALYFYTDTQAASFIARKYNSNTKVYTTIPGAQLTDTTIAGKQVVKLTYQITDGGDLDQDNTTNGTIVDPVGLAQTKTTAPDTGLQTYWLLGVKG